MDIDFGPGPGDWVKDGACANSTLDFFPSRNNHKAIAAAKAVCATCPVIEQCRAFARENDEFGVWGGENEADREAVKTAASYR